MSMQLRSSKKYISEQQGDNEAIDANQQKQEAGSGDGTLLEFRSENNQPKNVEIIRRQTVGGDCTNDQFQTAEQDSISLKRVASAQELNSNAPKRASTGREQVSSTSREVQYCSFESVDKDMKSVNLKCSILHTEMDREQQVLYLYDGTDVKCWGYDVSFTQQVSNKGFRLNRYGLILSKVFEAGILDQIPVAGSFLVLITRQKLEGLETLVKHQKPIGIQNVKPIVYRGQLMVVGEDDMIRVQLSDEEQRSWNRQVNQRILSYCNRTRWPIFVSCRRGTEVVVGDEGGEQTFNLIRDIQRHVIDSPQEKKQFHCLVRLLKFVPQEVANIVVQDEHCRRGQKNFHAELTVEDSSGFLDPLILTTGHGRVFFSEIPENLNGITLENVTKKMKDLVFKENGVWMDCCIKCCWDERTTSNYYIICNTKLIMD